MGSMRVSWERMFSLIPFLFLSEQPFRDDWLVFLQTRQWCLSLRHSWLNCLLNRIDGPGCFSCAFYLFYCLCPFTRNVKFLLCRFWGKASKNKDCDGEDDCKFSLEYRIWFLALSFDSGFNNKFHILEIHRLEMDTELSFYILPQNARFIHQVLLRMTFV